MRTNFSVVLLSGKQGSGKSTLAAGLVKALSKRGVPATQLKFADTLYKLHEACRAVCEEAGVPFEKKEGKLLQFLGTEWGRACKGEGVWVDAAKRAAERALQSGFEVVVFDDCRYRNEFDAFPDALRVRLEAPGEVRKSRAEGWREPGPQGEHSSETDLDNYVSCARFDLVVHTAEKSKDETLELVLEKLFGADPPRLRSGPSARSAPASRPQGGKQ